MSVINWVGQITGETLLEAYHENHIQGDLVVSGGTLRIEPGATVRFTGHCRLKIARGGSIDSVGTLNRPITWCSHAGRDRWSACYIIIESDAQFVRIRHNRIIDSASPPSVSPSMPWRTGQPKGKGKALRLRSAQIQQAFSYALLELETQIEMAAVAFQRLAAARSGQEQEGMWTEIHGFLVHAANISKLLWPATQDEKYYAIGKHVRRFLRGGGLARLRNRALRNHLEHFNERVAEWASSSTGNRIVDLISGPFGSVGGLSKSECLRWYDPVRDVMVFRGEEFPIGKIAIEIGRLRSRLRSRQGLPS